MSNRVELRSRIADVLKVTNLGHKSRDFEHLLFNKQNAEKVKDFSTLFL